MKIKFEELLLHNFMSFEDICFSFDSSCYTLIKGQNNNPNDSASSNGSGKSSLWEAIVWCLTGDTIRGTKDVVRYGSEDGACVSLTLTVDNDRFLVARYKDPSKLKVMVNGQEKSGKGIRDTEVILKQLLPEVTTELLGSVIILGQGMPKRFTNNTPSGRKELLEQLSNSNFMLDDLKTRVNFRTNAIQSEINSLQINTLTGKKEVLEQIIQHNRLNLENLSGREELSAHLEASKTALENLTKELEEIDKDLTALSFSINLTQNDIDGYKEEIRRRKEEVKSSFQDKIIEHEKQKAILQADIASLKKEISRLKSITDVCPTCGQKLIGVQKPDTTDKEIDLKDLEYKFDVLCESGNTLNKELQEELSKIDELLSPRLDQELSILIDRKNKYQDVLKQKEEEVQKKDQAYKEVYYFENELNNLDKNKASYVSAIEDAEKQIKEIDDKILYNNKRVEELNLHLDVLKKMNTLLTRDFRGYLLKNIIEYINQKSKEYSKEVFDNGVIEFALDGNNISISFNGREYENLSSGERQKVDIVVQFALRDMLCKFSNFSSNILVLDEIFDGLDSVGCERVIKLLSTKLNDVDNVYIVTHRSDLEVPVDRELTVTKNEFGISTINDL